MSKATELRNPGKVEDWGSHRYDKEDAARLVAMWNDYHDANAKMQVKHDPNQPEEGIFKMSFVIPAEWGEVTERSSFTSPWGRPAEGLLFNRHGWIKRLTVPIQGYD